MTLRPGVALSLAVLAAPALAQGDTSVVAGAHYRAGSLHRAVLGAGYRDVWTAPVAVSWLDLDTVGGGLRPTERGGGNQTRSLRFRTADGRELAFRSVDKDPVTPLGRDVKGTLAGAVIQDLVSAQHPSGQLAVDVMEDALGIEHPARRLYLMPDDARLGEYRAEFAGMLGYLEERPAAGATRLPGLAEAAAIEGSDDFLKALAGGDRLDVQAYLATRLLDLLIGDWDRHEDQYRWARFDRGGVRVWRPVPRDRDYAFVNYGGVGLSAARHVFPKVVAFGPDPAKNLLGLIENAQRLDRRLLGGVDRPAWDSAAAWVTRRLTDSVIDEALRRMPPEHRARSAAFLASRLRERRAALGGAAARLYGWLTEEPNLYGGDGPDLAEVERLADGSVDVLISGDAGPMVRRRFSPAETREVRLYLLGGDDRAVVRGGGPGRIAVRVIGGDGDDLLADSSARGGAHFYDQSGHDRFVRRRGTTVDRRSYTEPKWTLGNGLEPPREWGHSSSLLSPAFGWRSRIGPFVGVGPSWKDWGFRRVPFQGEGHLQLLVAPLERRVGIEYTGSHHFTGDPRWLDLQLRATGLAATDFFGYGNETPAAPLKDAHRFVERQLLVEPTWHFPLTPHAWLSAGPTLEWRDPEPEPMSIALLDAVPGSARWAALGARAGLEIDHRDRPAFPRLGWSLTVSADGFPLVRELDGAFAGGEAIGAAYLGGHAGPVLALRAGGRAAWGDFPVQRAAFAGGGGTLRGFPGDRFAGDRAAFGSAELREPLFRANLGVRGTLGALVLGDAGRVWVDGDSPGDWHTAYGGGIYFHFLNGSRSASAYLARGEATHLYVQLGMPF